MKPTMTKGIPRPRTHHTASNVHAGTEAMYSQISAVRSLGSRSFGAAVAIGGGSAAALADFGRWFSSVSRGTQPACSSVHAEVERASVPLYIFWRNSSEENGPDFCPSCCK